MRAASSSLTATDTRRQTVTLTRYSLPGMLGSLALSATAWADAGSFRTETPLRRRRLSRRALSGSRRGRATAPGTGAIAPLGPAPAAADRDGPSVRLLLWAHATGQGRAQHAPVRGTGDAGDATRCRVCRAPLSSQYGAGSGTTTCCAGVGAGKCHIVAARACSCSIRAHGSILPAAGSLAAQVDGHCKAAYQNRETGNE